MLFFFFIIFVSFSDKDILYIKGPGNYVESPCQIFLHKMELIIPNQVYFMKGIMHHDQHRIRGLVIFTNHMSHIILWREQGGNTSFRYQAILQNFDEIDIFSYITI